MTADLHPNARRVVEAAEHSGLTIEVRRFPDGTKTAADAARAIGVEVGQIVKSLVFAVDHEDGREELVLALVSGSNRLDEGRLAHAADATGARRVDADRVRDATGFPIGGVPPLASATPLRIFVDPDLLSYAEVWAAAGTWHDVFGVAPGALVEAVAGRVVPLKRI